MNTEFERISEIMYTLLEHQPVIDVPYEKINDIAVALVKENYGKISEYENEREMFGSQIKVLKQRLNNKYVEIERLKANLDYQIDATNDAENLASHLQYDYDKCFKRLKSTQKELNELKDKLKSIAHVEPIKDVIIIKRSDFDNLMEENKQ